jgi:ribosomal protein S18 acetylase RimI-like enzyme
VSDLQIRTYQPADQPAVQRLYEAGSLAGQVAPSDSDTGSDIDLIREAYLQDARNHFWVAQKGDRVVGMIGVMSDDEHTAEIRRLRVDPDHQGANIGQALLETALEHCREQSFLKIRLDTTFEKDHAVDLFDRVGFQHTRSRNVHGKELLEFYLDLYRDPAQEGRG